MKVLVVLTGELCFDGITNSVLNYFRAMDRSGMDIGIVSARSTNSEMRKNFEDFGCMIYPLENRDTKPLKYFCSWWILLNAGNIISCMLMETAQHWQLKPQQPS